MLDSPIPQISISFAPEEAIIPEPKSPLAGWAKAADDDDAFRSKHLTPPPTVSPRFFQKVSSPLRPDQSGQDAGKGLEKERFEAMLRSARERGGGGVGAKKSDLRKEVALKVHQTKQVERRALFLSKVMAPPSPRSTSLPKTPPESPAIFHYTLPSPGLVSPLALFESLEKEALACGPNVPKRRSWVEQVDFRRRDDHITKQIRKEQVKEPVPSSYHVKQHTMPSLDEISARIKTQRRESSMHMPTIVVESETGPAPRQGSHRLPAFLQRRASSAPNLETTPTTDNVPDSRPRVPFSRLNMPVRTSSLNAPIQVPQPKAVAPPRSPLLSPKLQVTTIVVPRTSRSSPTKLSESNVQALATRERSSKNMITTLRRRTPGAAYTTDSVPEPPKRINEDAWKGSKWKRHSAPAELQARSRIEFHHPVLNMRGGF